MQTKAAMENPIVRISLLDPRGYSLVDVIAFVIGLSSAYYLSLIGQVYLAEILLPLVIPLLWRNKNKYLLLKEAKWLSYAGIAWLLSQIVSDLILSTPFFDSLRGWALIAVFLVDWLALYLLLMPNPRRIILSLFGFALGGLFQPILQPDKLFLADAWKFGFGQPLTLLLVLVICVMAGNSLVRNAFWSLPLGIVGLLSIYLDFRSMGGIALLTAALMFFSSILLNNGRGKRVGLQRMVMLGLLIIGLSWMIFAGYTYAAKNGWLGSVSRVNYQLQYAEGLKVIINGRSDVIPAFYAIKDSPWIGHGSWARDPKYRNYYYDLIRLGYIGLNETSRIDYLVTSSNTIPAHSHILQSWIWSGVMGAFFWLVVLVIVIRALITTIKFPNVVFAFILFSSFLSVWNLLFSPFGSLMRLQWAYFLTASLYILMENDRFSLRRKIL